MNSESTLWDKLISSDPGLLGNALALELRESRSGTRLAVESSCKIGGSRSAIAEFKIKDRDGLVPIDRDMVDCNLWWPSKPRGAAARVLAVKRGSGKLIAEYGASELPDDKESIHVYPPDFLTWIAEIYRDPRRERALIEAFRYMVMDNKFNSDWPPEPDAGVALRRGQTDAFKLLGHRVGLLWGPPGTGKTTTAAAMVSAYLDQYPQARVLVVANNNSAVDQLVTTIAKHAPTRLTNEFLVKGTGLRLGSRYSASKYKDCEFLLVKDQRLRDRKESLEQSVKELERDNQFEALKLAKDSLKALDREISKAALAALSECRFVGMTATYMAIKADELAQVGRFDLVVIDESSQLSLPYALLAASFAEHQVLFTGDPNQLAPIVQSNMPNTQEWLRASIFELLNNGKEMPSSATCILKEQSRMVEDICKVVAKLSYKGKDSLRVAKGCNGDSNWEHNRAPLKTKTLGDKSAVVVPIKERGGSRLGYVRFESKALALKIARECLLVGYPANEILIVAPYRKQQAELRRAITKDPLLRGVRVSTVHRAQGGEALVVIYDPVCGDSPFMRLPEHRSGFGNPDAARLLNVAISRAKARLVVLLSEYDCCNPLYYYLARAIRPSAVGGMPMPTREASPHQISSNESRNRFPVGAPIHDASKIQNFNSLKTLGRTPIFKTRIGLARMLSHDPKLRRIELYWYHLGDTTDFDFDDFLEYEQRDSYPKELCPAPLARADKDAEATTFSRPKSRSSNYEKRPPLRRNSTGTPSEVRFDFASNAREARKVRASLAKDEPQASSEESSDSPKKCEQKASKATIVQIPATKKPLKKSSAKAATKAPAEVPVVSFADAITQGYPTRKKHLNVMLEYAERRFRIQKWDRGIIEWFCYHENKSHMGTTNQFMAWVSDLKVAISKRRRRR